MVTYLSFALAKNRLGCIASMYRRAIQGRRTAAVLECLLMTASMIYAIADLDCIGPYEFLCVVQPPRLELVLTDGTDAGCQHGIIRHGNVLRFRCLCDCAARRGICIACWDDVVLIDRLTRFYPILLLLEEPPSKRTLSRLLTISSTSQLRCNPRFSVSLLRWFTRKCQSMCAVFLLLPSSFV